MSVSIFLPFERIYKKMKVFSLINSVYDWIYPRKIQYGFLCAAGAVIIYLHYKKKKDDGSSAEKEELSVKFYKNEIPSELEEKEGLSVKNEIPSEPEEKEGLSVKNEIPSEPEEKEGLSVKNEIPSEPEEKEGLSVKNEIPSEPEEKEGLSVKNEIPSEPEEKEGLSVKNEIPSEPEEKEELSVKFYKNEIPSELEEKEGLSVKNEIPSEPEGDYIENILTYWVGDYDKLENHHHYIQWLFPNQEAGVNPHSHHLKNPEAEIIRNKPELKERVKRSFEMMLDFYGMALTEENKFVCADNAAERLKELNQWGNHNFLCISRILLALKLLGHSDLILPWMKFLVDLIYVEKVLEQATASFEEYWIETLDAEDKIELNKYKKARE